MKKIAYHRFGGTEVLQMEEAPMPDGDVVVKVKAVSVNPLDWKLWQGEMKMMSGRTFPKAVGIDFSGVVERGGGKYRKGDEVFGMVGMFKGGALAEYVAVSEKDIAIKPKAMSFEEAAGLPVAGSAALQIFDKLLKLEPGMEVLINGAGGGIGPFAIQLAKQAGAVVTAAVGPGAVEMAAGIGADIVLDYRKQDVRAGGKRFDVVIDLSGKISYRAAKPLLKPAGVYVNTSPGLKEMLGSLFARRRYKLLLLKPSSAYLEKLARVGLRIIVGKRYRFEEYRKGYEEVKGGGVQGKAVFVIE